MKCLYVCTKEVLDRASGMDMPVYIKWPVGSVAWFEQVPDKKHWQELEQYTGLGFTNRMVFTDRRQSPNAEGLKDE